jgi:hypothetical protein
MKPRGISTLILLSVFFTLSCSAHDPSTTQKNKSTSTQKIVLLMSETVDEEDKINPVDLNTKDLLHYLEQQLNLEFEFRRYPWIRAMQHTLRGEGLLLGMSKTREREHDYVFSDPISYSANWLVTRCDQPFPFKELQDLKGKTIGIVKGTSSGAEFDRARNNIFNVEEDTVANFSRLNKLKMRRMDAQVWFDFQHDAKRLEARINRIYQRESRTPIDQKLFCILPKPISILTNHLASDKHKNAELIKHINQAIAKGRKSGALPQLQ